MATNCAQVELLRAGVIKNGVPVSFGTVAVYLAGTTTVSTLYATSDSGGAVLSNPVALDVDGKAAAWGNTEYKFVISDQSGMLVDTIDNYSVRLVSSLVALKDTTLQTNLNADMVDSAHAGNGSGNVALSNGTLCTDLNADKLDGAHAAAFAVLATGNSLNGNQTLTGGSITLASNNTAIIGAKTDTTQHNLVKIDGSNVLQVGSTSTATNLNDNGTMTRNGIAFSPITQVKSFVDSDDVSTTAGGADGTYDSGDLGLTPVLCNVTISARRSAGATYDDYYSWGVALSGTSFFIGQVAGVAPVIGFPELISGTGMVGKSKGNAGDLNITVSHFAADGIRFNCPADVALGGAIAYKVCISVVGY